MEVEHHWYMPFSRRFPCALCIAITLEVDRFRRHKDVDGDDGILPTWQGNQKRVWSLWRRDVEDRQRYESRKLYECRTPLDTGWKAEEIGNRVPVATQHVDGLDASIAALMARRIRVRCYV